MKTRISLALVLALAVGSCWAQGYGDKGRASGNQADEDKIVQMEKDLWEAWKKHDANAFKQNLPAESVNVGAQGVEGTDKIVEEIGKSDCQVNNYSLENTKVNWLDKNTALLTYKANQDATCGGQKIPPAVWASSLWVKRGGKWQAYFHQETPAQEATQSAQKPE